VESRIVQRALLNVLVTMPALKPYFETPFSFGGIRKAKVANAKSRRDDPSAVPAAIRAVLNEIEKGATHFVAAGIRSFFTRVSKAQVLSIISDAVQDAEFTEFLERAITVELSNLAELKHLAKNFPTSDIGVAQGNSLSPLLGNIALAEFDKIMNEEDCRCMRYIDDFIIVAPSAKAANARYRKAVAFLKGLGMELSPDKTSKGAQKIENGFAFLGIEVVPGRVRPSRAARHKLLSSLEIEFTASRKAFEQARNGKRMPRARSLITTLKRVDGMIEGWGKHYWFCDDNKFFAELDSEIMKKIGAYLGSYKNIRSRTDDAHHRAIMGIAELSTIKRDPFQYPRKRIPVQTSQTCPARPAAKPTAAPESMESRDNGPLLLTPRVDIEKTGEFK
jgi:RNA-directed DNA polymerase